jgi:hypothetical protein
MKNFLNTLYNFFQSLGEAKAASALARAGLHKEAETLMTK